MRRTNATTISPCPASILWCLSDGTTQQIRTFNRNDPLKRVFSSDNFSAAGSYNEVVAGFQTTLTVDAGYSAATTLVDRRADTAALQEDAAAGLFALDAPLPAFADAGFDTAKTNTTSVSQQADGAGSAGRFAGGRNRDDVRCRLRLGPHRKHGYAHPDGHAGLTQLVRGDLSGGVSVVVPITSARRDVLGCDRLAVAERPGPVPPPVGFRHLVPLERGRDLVADRQADLYRKLHRCRGPAQPGAIGQSADCNVQRAGVRFRATMKARWCN